VTQPRLFVLAVLTSLSSSLSLLSAQDTPPACEAIISVPDQKLVVLRDGGVVAKYPVSTSRFGIGDGYGTYRTPLGRLKVCEKLGDRLPAGAVIKHRHATGEVLPPNARGRDPIVTRILWLDGLEAQNAHARERSIYIHGTPEEKTIGRPASYGCIRMKSQDVIALYNELNVGAPISIIPDKLPRLGKYVPRPEPVIAQAEPPAPKIEPAPIASIARPEQKVLASANVGTKAAEVKAVQAQKLEPAEIKVAKNSAKPESSVATVETKRAKVAKSAIASATSATSATSSSGLAGDTRLAAASVDQNRLAFLRNHEAAMLSLSSASAPASGADLSSRMKGSILDAGLSQ